LGGEEELNSTRTICPASSRTASPLRVRERPLLRAEEAIVRVGTGSFLAHPPLVVVTDSFQPLWLNACLFLPLKRRTISLLFPWALRLNRPRSLVLMPSGY
jgi:hypothetical protein